LVKHCPILIIFGRNIPEVNWLEEVVFISHINFVSSLPGEIFKKRDFDPFLCYMSVFQFFKKDG